MITDRRIESLDILVGRGSHGVHLWLADAGEALMRLIRPDGLDTEKAGNLPAYDTYQWYSAQGLDLFQR